MDNETRHIRAIDLFAGVGGSSRGATSAGITLVAAVDRWPLARDTYQSNFPEVKFLLENCEDWHPAPDCICRLRSTTAACDCR
jgi:DNA (cytosine-5)-methyltransferase 1